MNGSTENRASEASKKGGIHDRILTWTAANRMLPLVQHIVADLLACQQRLATAQPEKERLDRHRRDLSWPERARRYQLDDEISGDEQSLRTAYGELDGLGIALLDYDSGRVGFPMKSTTAGPTSAGCPARRPWTSGNMPTTRSAAPSPPTGLARKTRQKA